MTPDFYASYISGSIGILIGNPLDIIKVRLQSQPPSPASSITSSISTTSQPPLWPTNSDHLTFLQKSTFLVRGTAAPILGYGALNALLFMTYNRTSTFLGTHPIFGSLSSFQRADGVGGGVNLWNTWIAGAIGGLATWIISTPTEIIKCRVQVSRTSTVSSLPSSNTPSSYTITKSILRTSGFRGLFHGGVVTALRDSIGYGFYFWSYELLTGLFTSRTGGPKEIQGTEAMKVLLCGGIAGVVTWGSVFPLDVIKTRVQTQSPTMIHSSSSPTSNSPLLNSAANSTSGPLSAWQITSSTYRTEGLQAFWRGFGVCCVRAFIVNAVQWATYEWIMRSCVSKA